jgi:hypothetical protein
MVKPMVSPNYLLQRSGTPSTATAFFTQKIVPWLIDAAGSMEAALERIAVRSRKSPGTALGVAFGVGVLLAFQLRRRS